MKKRPFIIIMVLLLLLELAAGIFVFKSQSDPGQDAVLVNECVRSIETNFGDSDRYSRSLDYVLLDEDGEVLFKTADGLTESINEAVKSYDTILDIEQDGNRVGRIIIQNRTGDRLEEYRKQILILYIFFAVFSQAVLLLIYFYLKKTILDPFDRLGDFAVRVAGGDLDLPLDVDRGHVFGAFTEAFDLMRSELKRSRLAERKANDEKKEVIAKLSHDIKTPVASIKSTSELGYELACDEKTKDRFRLINDKSDQLNALVTNLFHSSVNDITQIEVHPVQQSSRILIELIRGADHRHKAGDFDVPECDIYVDKLRLQQALDNIFMNSYKYADTPIDVSIVQEDACLIVRIADHGPGVPKEELPLLKEKFKRGADSRDKEGAGLGLYLADSFLNAMNGSLSLESDGGFIVNLSLRRI